ncbi:MAG: hypothetical protein U0R51_05415 [Solirubrobacterales bacterium]
MDRNELRLSPALVVAIVALVLAVAGTAVAGPAVLERALTKAKVKAIATKVTNRAVPAYAHIDPAGIVDAANSKGISQANVVAGSVPGYYCFRDLSFQPRGGSAIVDWNASPDLLATIGLGGNGSCPSGTEFFVDMRELDGSGSTAGGFFVTINR